MVSGTTNDMIHGSELKLYAWTLFDDIIRLPSEASIDHDHEALLHDIIRLPSEASVDHDHEAVLHDIMSARESTCLHD